MRASLANSHLPELNPFYLSPYDSVAHIYIAWSQRRFFDDEPIDTSMREIHQGAVGFRWCCAHCCRVTDERHDFQKPSIKEEGQTGRSLRQVVRDSSRTRLVSAWPIFSLSSLRSRGVP